MSSVAPTTQPSRLGAMLEAEAPIRCSALLCLPVLLLLTIGRSRLPCGHTASGIKVSSRHTFRCVATDALDALALPPGLRPSSPPLCAHPELGVARERRAQARRGFDEFLGIPYSVDDVQATAERTGDLGSKCQCAALMGL